MKRLLVLAFALAIALAASHDAWAQRARGGRGFGGGGGFGLLAQKSVQDELKLSDDQVKQVTEQMEKQRESFAGAQDLSREERQKRFAERQKSNQESIGKILNGEQFKRFKQIDLQQRGAQALGDDEVATALNLTAEQKQQVTTIQDSMRGEMREAFQGGGGNREEARKKIEALQTSTNDKLKALLSSEQQSRWKELTGEPFKGEIRRPQPRGGNRPAGAGRRQAPNRASQAEISGPTFHLASFRANEEVEEEVARTDRGPNAEVWSHVAKAADQRPHWRGHEVSGQDRDGNRFYARHRGHHGRGAGWRGRGYHGQRFVEHGPGHHGQGQQFARHHHGDFRHGHHFAGRHDGYRGDGPEFARHHGYHGQYRHGHDGHGRYDFASHDRGRHHGHAQYDARHLGHRGHGPAHFAADRGPHGYGHHGHSHHFASWRSQHPHRGDHFDRPRDDRPGRPPMSPGPPDHRRGELGPPDQSLASAASDHGNTQAEATQLAQFERNLSSLAEQIEALRQELRR